MTNLSGANLNNGTAVGPQGEGRDSLSTFPAYPAYKDSGVEWLGRVPGHWTVQPLKRAIAKIESGTSVNAADYPAELGSYGVLKTSCVYTGRFDWRENKTVDDEDLGRVSCPLKIDTLVVSRMNTPDLVGATGLVTEAPAGLFLPDRLWQVYFEKDQSASFVFYFTKAPEYREQVKTACSGTSSSMQNLGQDDFRTILFVEPPLAEQTQIARFLDHETARIDALIEEQQRLIELLKEKRQAVISHAVTKGLDPTVPMKDSGVEWLGEVPAHWVVSRAKLVSDIFVPQRNKPELNDSEGITWVTMEDMNGGYISATNLKVTELAADEAGSKVLKKGAVIASCVGRFGIVAINAVDVVINQQLQAFEPRKIKAEYLKNIVSLSKEYFELIGTAATLVYVNQQGFENLPVLIPSVSEQESICLYVDEANARFDALLSQSFESIQLLQERRSALISAAVTGKIDVRDWQPATAASDITEEPMLMVAEPSAAYG